jgi:hypothetical protein
MLCVLKQYTQMEFIQELSYWFERGRGNSELYIQVPGNYIFVITFLVSAINRPFSNLKHTAVYTDYRLIGTGLALFISKLFIGTSESLWNLKVFVLL